MKQEYKGMRVISNMKLMLFALILIPLLAVAVHADTELTGTTCGQIAGTYGERYYLTHDIVSDYSGDWCIAITNHYVEIDCQGYTIDGNGTMYSGIALGDETLFPTVRNCNIVNFQFGLSYEGADNVSVINNTFSNILYYAASIGLQHVGGLMVNNTVNSSAGGFQFGSSGGSDYVIANNIFGADVPNPLFFAGPSYVNYQVYNNYFANGNTSIYDDGASLIYYNTTRSSETNIVGLPAYGGNFYGDCTDLNRDGYCDAPVEIFGSNIDYSPLSLNDTPPAVISSCGTIISTPGYYELNSDITETGFNDACIDVSSTNIHIDCNGHTIDGAGVDTYAFRVTATEDFELKNCVLTNFLVVVDIEADSSGSIWIHNNTVSNGLIGINSAAFGTIIESNTVTGTTYAINNGATAVIKSNVFTGNSYDFNDGGNPFPGTLVYNNSFLDGAGSIISVATIYNDWNVTAQSGARIFGSGFVGGNYWGVDCTDANTDGFCDSPVVIDANNTDYLPLSSHFIAPIPNNYGFPMTVSSQSEYAFSQNGTVVIQFMTRDSGGHMSPVDNGTCTVNIFYPDFTIFVSDTMVYVTGSNGMYVKTFVTPLVDGIYVFDANCTRSSDYIYSGGTFHVSNLTASYDYLTSTVKPQLDSIETALATLQTAANSIIAALSNMLTVVLRTENNTIEINNTVTFMNQSLLPNTIWIP